MQKQSIVAVDDLVQHCGVLLHRLLSFVLVACIALTALAPRAIAKAPAPHAAMQMSGKTMDCCPGKHVPAECPKCPLMAFCASVYATAAMPEAVASPVARIADRMAPSNEPSVDGLGVAPPLDPPRS